MSVNIMVLNWKLAYWLSIENKAFEAGFSNGNQLWMKQSGTQSGLGK